MRAWRVREACEPSAVLRLVDVHVSGPGPGQRLVRRRDQPAVRECHDALTELAARGLISPVVSGRLFLTRAGRRRPVPR